MTSSLSHHLPTLIFYPHRPSPHHYVTAHHGQRQQLHRHVQLRLHPHRILVYRLDRPLLGLGRYVTSCSRTTRLTSALAVHSVQAWRAKYWVIYPSLVLGALIEVLGWAGRLWSNRNILYLPPFLMQICTYVCRPSPLAQGADSAQPYHRPSLFLCIRLHHPGSGHPETRPTVLGPPTWLGEHKTSRIHTSDGY